MSPEWHLLRTIGACCRPDHSTPLLRVYIRHSGMFLSARPYTHMCIVASSKRHTCSGQLQGTVPVMTSCSAPWTFLLRLPQLL
jgi:hypothetical protein